MVPSRNAAGCCPELIDVQQLKALGLCYVMLCRAAQVRFDFFCKAALEFLLKTGRQPNILHCHDWSTAHVAKAFWEDYQPYGLYNPKVGTMFTLCATTAAC